MQEGLKSLNGVVAGTDSNDSCLDCDKLTRLSSDVVLPRAFAFGAPGAALGKALML